MTTEAKTTNISIRPDKYELYVEADKRIAQKLGRSPGPEALMALLLESEEDSDDLAEVYCHTILRHAAA